jgi:hypothetical protein
MVLSKFVPYSSCPGGAVIFRPVNEIGFRFQVSGFRI